MVIKALVVAATIIINVKLASSVSLLAATPTVDEEPTATDVLGVACNVVIEDDDDDDEVWRALEVLSKGCGAEETATSVEVITSLLDDSFEVDMILLDELLEMGDIDAILLAVLATMVVSILLTELLDVVKTVKSFSDGVIDLVEDLVSFAEVVVGFGVTMLVVGLVLELEVTMVTAIDDVPEEDEVTMVTAADDVTEEDDDGDEGTAVTSSVTAGEENKGVADETEGVITSADTLWTKLVTGGLKDALNSCDTTLGDKTIEIEDTDSAVLDKGTACVDGNTTEESSWMVKDIDVAWAGATVVTGWPTKLVSDGLVKPVELANKLDGTSTPVIDGVTAADLIIKEDGVFSTPTDETDTEATRVLVKLLMVSSIDGKMDDDKMVEPVSLLVKTFPVGEKVIVGVNKMSLRCSGIEDNCLAVEDVNEMEVFDWLNFIVLMTVYIDVSKALLLNVVVGDKTTRSANDVSPLPSVDKSPLPSAVPVFSPTSVGWTMSLWFVPATEELNKLSLMYKYTTPVSLQEVAWSPPT